MGDAEVLEDVLREAAAGIGRQLYDRDGLFGCGHCLLRLQLQLAAPGDVEATTETTSCLLWRLAGHGSIRLQVRGTSAAEQPAEHELELRQHSERLGQEGVKERVQGAAGQIEQPEAEVEHPGHGRGERPVHAHHQEDPGGQAQADEGAHH